MSCIQKRFSKLLAQQIVPAGRKAPVISDNQKRNDIKPNHWVWEDLTHLTAHSILLIVVAPGIFLLGQQKQNERKRSTSPES